MIWSRKPVSTKTTGKYRFPRSRKRSMHDFTVSTAHVRSMIGNLQHGILNCCENQAFFNYFHSKVFFLIFVHVCFTFQKYVTKIECLCKYSNYCFVFWIPVLLSTYLETTGRNIILCIEMLLLRNKSHFLISMIVVKIEI